jgi:hypothetical protein
LPQGPLVKPLDALSVLTLVRRFSLRRHRKQQQASELCILLWNGHAGVAKALSRSQITDAHLLSCFKSKSSCSERARRVVPQANVLTVGAVDDGLELCRVAGVQHLGSGPRRWWTRWTCHCGQKRSPQTDTGGYSRATAGVNPECQQRGGPRCVHPTYTHAARNKRSTFTQDEPCKDLVCQTILIVHRCVRMLLWAQSLTKS